MYFSFSARFTSTFFYLILFNQIYSMIGWRQQMAIGAKHATIYLLSCAVYYAWHRKLTRAKAANRLAWHWNLGGFWCWWDWLECSWFSRLVEMAGVSPLESHEARMTETSNLGDQNFHPLSCVMCDFQVGKGGSKCWFLDVIMPLVSNLPNTVQDLRMINDIMAKPDWIMFGEVE